MASGEPNLGEGLRGTPVRRRPLIHLQSRITGISIPWDVQYVQSVLYASRPKPKQTLGTKHGRRKNGSEREGYQVLRLEDPPLPVRGGLEIRHLGAPPSALSSRIESPPTPASERREMPTA